MAREFEHPSLAALGAWGFVGAGALGSSLARALAARGCRIAAVTTRRPDHARQLADSLTDCASLPSARDVALACDVVVLAVPDDAIAALDEALPWHADQFVVHLSGARGLDVLRHATASGARTAACHPLMIFPGPEPTGEAALARLAGCYWAVEASDEAADAAAHAVIGALDGHVVRLRPEDRVPYHLSAVLVSNYVVTALGTAVNIWRDLGLDPASARAALLPLLHATVERLSEQGPAGALAGPIARGDAGTLARHMAWLNERAASGPSPDYAPRDLLAAYVAMARLTVPLAVERGSLAPEDAQRLLHLLDRATDAERGQP